MDKFPSWSGTLIALLGLGIGAMPMVAAAHPMGNFSISHYAGITVDPRRVEVRYLIDMAEIPTFQELQDTGLVADVGHASVKPWSARPHACRLWRANFRSTPTSSRIARRAVRPVRRR